MSKTIIDVQNDVEEVEIIEQISFEDLIKYIETIETDD